MLPPDPDSFLPAALEPEDQSAIGDLDNEVEADLDMDLFEPILVSRASVAVNPPGFPPIFQYSQDNLQAYTVCARRFQLRHLVRQAWPEPVTGAIDELEDELQIGDHFHRLVERHSLGIVVPPPIDTPLADWWQAFLHHPPRDLPTDPLIRKVEAFYSVPFGGRRLVAKFDLLAIVPGERVVIVDWKTSIRPPIGSCWRNGGRRQFICMWRRKP